MEPFVYRARLVRVIDGDTLDVVLDAGFGIWFGNDKHLPMRLRLLGVNTRELHASNPEVRAQAQADMQLTGTWLTAHDNGSQWPLLVRTSRDDVFGRYLADVFGVADANESLSAYLLGQGIPPFKRSLV